MVSLGGGVGVERGSWGGWDAPVRWGVFARGQTGGGPRPAGGLRGGKRRGLGERPSEMLDLPLAEADGDK